MIIDTSETHSVSRLEEWHRQPRPWTETGFLPCGYGQLRYSACGRGTPLIMLPKLGGWIDDWRHVAALLSATCRVIAIDPPGHGGSCMAVAPPYVQTVPESAAAIIAGLQSIGVDQFVLAGNSLGGCIGIAMAALWPEAVKKLVLIDVSMDVRVSYAELAESDRAQPPGTYAADGTPQPRNAADLKRFGPMSESLIAEQNASRAACGIWLRPSERGVGRMGTQSYLPRLKSPVLAIMGALGFYARYAQTAQRLIADAQVHILAGAGPFVHQVHPDIVAARMTEFLGEPGEH